MNDRPLFTVIIPTYNRPALLAEAMASVQGQSVSDFECLIVNDAGPEPIRLPDDPRFRVVQRRENGGQGASFNTGIRAARGQYVVFLDDDDLFRPDRLEIALEGLRAAPVSVCLSQSFGQNRTRRRRGPSTPRILRGDVGHLIREDMTPNMGQTAEEWIEKVRVIVAELHDKIIPGCEDAFKIATRSFEQESKFGEKVVAYRSIAG